VHLSRHSKSSVLLNFIFSVNVSDRVFETVRLLVSDTLTCSISASQTVLPSETSSEVVSPFRTTCPIPSDEASLTVSETLKDTLLIAHTVFRRVDPHGPILPVERFLTP